MQRWVEYNVNPLKRRVGDCAIRACCKATGRSYGVVEYEDGTIHKVDPECIAFTDNHVISVNIDYDMIANAVTKMMKD